MLCEGYAINALMIINGCHTYTHITNLHISLGSCKRKFNTLSPELTEDAVVHSVGIYVCSLNSPCDAKHDVVLVDVQTFCKDTAVLPNL